MVLKKISLLFGFLFSLVFCGDWVLDYKGVVFYEDDFYAFFPKKDWEAIKTQQKKQELFFDYIKRSASVYEAKALGLDVVFDVEKRLAGRFERLLVNEYYMRDFLLSVTPKSGLAFCQKNLKKEVYVKHILVENNLLEKEVLDSLVAGVSFDSLAVSFSVDPSVKSNFGTLGWIGIGETVPEFQNSVFSLCVGCFGSVKTGFGNHVVRVDSVRSSEALALNKDDYNDLAFRFATAYIKEPLSSLAAQHDSLLLDDAGVVFDLVVLKSFVGLVKETLLTKKRREEVNFLGLLENVSSPLVFYNGSFLSGAWFANKLSASFYKNPFFDSVEPFLKELNLIILRDIVFRLALEKGLDKNVFFERQFDSIRNTILEKEFLKHLVNSVNLPTKKEIEDFYYTNEKELFVSKTSGKPFGLSSSYGSVEAILLKEKQEKERLFFFDSLRDSSYVKINEVWLNEF